MTRDLEETLVRAGVNHRRAHAGDRQPYPCDPSQAVTQAVATSRGLSVGVWAGAKPKGSYWDQVLTMTPSQFLKAYTADPKGAAGLLFRPVCQPGLEQYSEIGTGGPDSNSQAFGMLFCILGMHWTGI